jgi:hypothetical protein
LYFGVGSLVCSLWLLHGPVAFNNAPQATLQKLIHGGATRPYSARLLMPALASALAKCIPESLATAAAGTPQGRQLLSVLNATPEFTRELSAAILLSLCSFVAWLYAFRAFSAHCYPAQPPGITDAAPALAAAGLPMFFVQGGHYVYDPPALLFATLLSLSIARRAWRTAFVLLFLAGLNKETAIVFVVVSAFWHGGALPRRELLRVVLTQALAVGAGRGLAMIVSNPAETIAPTNTYLRDYLGPNVVSLWRSPLFDRPEMLAALVVWSLLLSARWRAKPVFVRRSAVVTVAMLAPLYLVGGWWGEIRVFLEAFPLLALLVLDTVWRIVAGDGAVDGWMVRAVSGEARREGLDSSADTRMSTAAAPAASLAVGAFCLYASYTVWVFYGTAGGTAYRYPF